MTMVNDDDHGDNVLSVGREKGQVLVRGEGEGAKRGGRVCERL